MTNLISEGSSSNLVPQTTCQHPIQKAMLAHVDGKRSEMAAILKQIKALDLKFKKETENL